MEQLYNCEIEQLTAIERWSKVDHGMSIMVTSDGDVKIDHRCKPAIALTAPCGEPTHRNLRKSEWREISDHHDRVFPSGEREKFLIPSRIPSEQW